MVNPTVVTDPVLGAVVFKQNPRARRYILRMNAKGVAVTIPRGGNMAFAEGFFSKYRAQLIKQKEASLLAETGPTGLALPQTPQAVEQLRRQAWAVLPAKLQALAERHGFRYQSLSIRRSRTRWGSCSSKKTISLSLFLVLLPAHLVDYVLLHELCHTVEMNHSPAFWALLDRHTGGRAQALRKELKGYRC